MLCHREALEKQSGFRYPPCSYRVCAKSKAYAAPLRRYGEATKLSIVSTLVLYASNTGISYRHIEKQVRNHEAPESPCADIVCVGASKLYTVPLRFRQATDTLSISFALVPYASRN